MILRIVVMLLLLATTSFVLAQEPTPESTAEFFDALNTTVIDAFFEVDNGTPLIGEPITVTLTVDMPLEAELAEWPEVIGDDFLEVLELGEVEVETTETRTIHRQEVQLVLWDTGEFLAPELFVSAIIDGKLEVVPVRSFFVFVPSLIGDLNSASLRPPMPPLDLPFTPRWIFGGAGFASILAILVITRFIQTSKRDVARVVAGSPSQITIAQLEDLKLQRLPAMTVYPLVADSLRQYLQLEFDINAIEMTTGEINTILDQSDLLTRTQRRGLNQLLEQADLVKFARFQPDNETGTRLINYAIRWLRETERERLSEGALDD